MKKKQFAKTAGERPKGKCWILKSINKKTGIYTWYYTYISIKSA